MSACGIDTYTLDPGHIESSNAPVRDWKGMVVELARETSECPNGRSGEGLLAVVDLMAIEFPAARIAALPAECGRVDPTVTVDIEDDAVIFDFSTIGRSGSFPRTDFDGYLVSVITVAPDLVSASIDRSSTTMLIGDEDVRFDTHSVSINTAGVAFDPTSRIELALEFAKVASEEEGDD